MNSTLQDTLRELSQAVAPHKSAPTAVSASTSSAPHSDQALSADDFSYLQEAILRESGISLDATKGYLLNARLLPVAQQRGLTSLEELCRSLRRGTPGLMQQVVEAITTHETLFFRDQDYFNALRHVLLPQLLERSKGRKLLLWSAATATGQEAYSLALLLLEMGINADRFSILATDLSEKVLTRARLGSYGDFEVRRGLPENHLHKYFFRNGTQWQVTESLRKLVRFEKVDLRDDLRSLGHFDLVLCRNVLIYFTPEAKQKILDSIASVLAPGGYLMLGTAESAGRKTAGLAPVLVENLNLYQATT